MAVKRNKKSRGLGRRVRHTVKGGLHRLRKKRHPAVSAPPASEEPPRNNHAGVLRFDTGRLRLPEALAEAGENETSGLMPGRIVTAITAAAIIFIAVIAWFVSKMPDK